ncbi:MAG: DUF4340 domain-containing protein [Chloroflexi bacterium]|nr:DUF4340 domain-containing protein [Chloroflexota bacterium]MCC6891890.1 DUF4340 domain-containing protein [Anaerolineae bacterium]
MRLNRGTLSLGLISVIVIVAALLLSQQEANNPASGTPTATSAAVTGPLFPDIAAVDAQSKIVRFEVVNTTDQSKVVMTKDAASVWTVAEATNSQELATDQTKAVGMMSNLASLEAVDQFTAESLVEYGLDTPDYILTLTDSDGKTYVVNVGNKTVTTPRYYVTINDDKQTVYLVQGSTIDMLVANIAIPAYVPSPTPQPTLTPSPNPYSEVEQTATAVVDQQNFALTLTAIVEVTAEATSEATAEATREALSEVTAEATSEAATDVPATNTPRPTATTVPATNTPRPTATDVPATSTTRPTATKTLTPTATPT